MTEEHFSLAGGINASFINDTPVALTESQRLHLAAHLPGIQPLPNAPEAPDIRIQHTESDTVSLQQKESHVHLHDKWDGQISPDFSHLFYGAARLAWLNKNMYPVHAACVGNDEDGYVLLVGHSGVGKTSTTCWQSAISSGLKIFSGDKTLVKIGEDGGIQAIGGTQAMTIRDEDRKRWPSLDGQGISNGDRYVFKLKPEQYATAPSVKIKAVVLMQLNDGVTKCQKLSPLSALHTLYPYFMDTERGDVLLAGGKAVFDGAPNAAIKLKLADTLGNSLQHVPTFNIIGPLQRVTSMINSITHADGEELSTIDTKLGQGRRP